LLSTYHFLNTSLYLSFLNVSPYYFGDFLAIESLLPKPPRCCHRAATVALCAAAAAPPPSCRQRCAVALSRCCHCLAAAKLPPTSAFALPPTSAFALPQTSAFALPPPPQLPRCCRRAAAAALPPSPPCRQAAADLALSRYRHCRCHRRRRRRHRRRRRRRAAVCWLVVAL
jgi:hypothetical protein